MSHVLRLEIRGMRSYSPNKSVCMEFARPVTLIVGHNGSGKTSVIECLKFACTGDTPPGNKGNFVHSPKIADEFEVRGQVKLEFKDLLDKQTLVSRTLLTQQKQVTATTKTLDGTIKREAGKDEHGNPKVESLSMRCADLDKEMIRCLGVSRSVLNNVIFCHQEESMWPLSEGSTVKKKFDEIFGQKRQVKCVEELRKKFKDLKLQNALNLKDLEHYQNNQAKAGELKEELEHVQIKMNCGKKDVETINKQIQELRENLDGSHKKVEEVRKLERKKDEFVTRLDTVERTKNQLEKGLQVNYPHPTEKLLQMLSSFERDFQDKRHKEHEFTMRLSDVVESHDKAEKNMQVYSEDLGRLREAQKAYNRLQEENEKSLASLAEKFSGDSSLLLGSRIKVPDDVNEIHWIEGKLDESRVREEKRERESRTQQEKMNKQSDELKKTLNQAQEKLKMKRESKRKLKEEMDKLLVEIREIKTSASTLSRLEQNKKSAEEELKQFQETSRLDEIGTKIEAKSKEMRNIAEKQSKLSSELEVLHLEAEARQDRERAENELSSKEIEMRKLISDHEEKIKKHLGEMPAPGGNSRALSKYLSTQSSDAKSQGDKLNEKQRSVAKGEMELKMAKQQLKEHETKARKIRDKIVEVCANPAIYESEVERAEVEYTRAKMQNTSIVGFTHIYSKFEEKVSSSHSCPICSTSLGEAQAQRVSQSLQRKVKRAPEEKEKAKQDETVAEKKLFALKAAANLYTELNELEREKIPELSERVTSLEKTIVEEKELAEDMEDAVQLIAVNEFEVRQMEKDLDYVDRLHRECLALKDKISSLSSRLVSSYSKTLKEAIEEQSRYQEEYSALQHEHSRLMDSKTRGETKCNALRQLFYSLQDEYVALSTKMQGLKGMEERRKEKALEIQELSQGERKVEETIKPNEEQLDVLERQLAKETEEDFSAQRQIRDSLNRLSNAVENSRKLEQQLSSSSGSSSGNVSSLSGRLEQCKEEYENLKTQKKKLEGQLQQLKRDLDSSQVQKRDLEGCLQIREFEQEMQSIKDEISTTERQLADKELSKARSTASKVQKDIEEKSTDKAGLEGRNKGLVEQVSRLEKELNSKMFKDAKTTYHHQNIKCHVGQQTSKDIEMFIIAYERAIMRFHKDKMEEINRTLRELWVEIYRGGDIDYIEIKTDDDEKESVSKRKTCNYRVSMNKGGTSIDMRQHSSAGQRVLAALLIRLALAETFCNNCGIITLDEPTTNLDRDNIESLAHALGKFIKSRQNTGHFQLIIITHDEDFVELLGRSAAIDHYYKVSKDTDYCSMITKKLMVD